MTTRTSAGRTARLLTAGLLLLPAAACSGETSSDAEEAVSSAAADASSAAEDASSAAETAVEDSPAQVDCSGTSCTLTLDAGQQADVLGTDVSFTSSEDGTATVMVGTNEATCREGETVEAGPLSLECTQVTEDQVSLTASLG